MLSALLLGTIFPQVQPDVTGWDRNFLPTFEKALAKSKKDKKPILIIFTGLYATNCRVMERNIFPDKRVQSEFAKFNKANLYTDRLGNPKFNAADEKNFALQRKFTKEMNLPCFVILDSKGKKVISKIGFQESPEKFAKWLAKSAK